MDEFESHITTLIPPRKPTAIRDKILLQAKLLFGQKGYCAVSMNDLVATIGITKPTIYYHFMDKETLFTETIIDMFRHGQELFSKSLLCCLTLREQLYSLCEGYFEHSPISLLTIVRDAEANLSQNHKTQVRDAHYQYLVSPIKKLFEEGMYNGEVEVDNAEELALLFVNWVDTLTALKMTKPDKPVDIQNRARRAVDTFMDGIARKP